MKLVEKEFYVYDIFSKEIIMRVEYKDGQYLQLMEYVRNMNECAEINKKHAYYMIATNYGVDYGNSENTK